jgi:hypothetical protein
MVGDQWEGRSYPSPILVVDMTLLQRALDRFLDFLGNLIEAVDTVEIVLGFLPPVMNYRWCHASPGDQVSHERD